MKRDRDGNHTSMMGDAASEGSTTLTNVLTADLVPPPPPPRRPAAVPALPRASPDSVPPPPPPRPPRSNGPAAVSNGAHNGSDAAKKARVDPSPVADAAGGVPASSSLKRARMGLEPPKGWRALADEVLLKAKGGAGGGGGGSEENGVSTGGKARKGGGGKQARLPRMSRRKFAAVCSANFNRSMMAHKLLREHQFRVESYGTGRDVRLPGLDASTPEVFPFGTPYRTIFDTLIGKNEDLFTRNNLLGLVSRNATIKAAPERFQELEGHVVAGFDVVLCFDSRVFYLVVEDLQSRDPETFKPLHVVNMTIKDSAEESAAASGHVLDLCRMLDGLSQLEDKAADLLEAFAKRTKRTILHQVCHV